MEMRVIGGFIARRLLGLAVLLFIISFLVFSLIYLAPGNLVDVLLGLGEKSPEVVAAIRQQYHLDDPFFVQYLIWLGNALHFDFGRSIILNQPVTAAIAGRMAITLFISVYGFIVAVVAGLVLGTAAALKRNTAVDRGAVGIAIFGVSAPSFATGLILLWLFAIQLGWFPVIGVGEAGFGDRFWHLTLPALALGVTGTALMTKMTRAALIDSLDQDYINFARSRGVGSVRILFVYGLRNSLIPIVTAAGLVIATTLTGSVLIEQTFSLQGIGSLLISSINNKDIPVVQGTTMLIAVLVVVVNLIVDLSYFIIDPRTRTRGALA
jgi:peptide/nickel transport system permease protein